MENSKYPSLIYFILKIIRRMSQKMSEKVRRKKNKGKYFEKSQNPLNLGKKSQNLEKNCRDFLIPKIVVRFFQSNLPLGGNLSTTT